MIRLKNLDLVTTGMKRIVGCEVTAAIASTSHCVFVAPVDGTLDSVYLHANNTGSTTILITTGDSTVALATAISAITTTSFGRLSVTLTGNNSLTAGTPVVFQLSATAAIFMHVQCVFTPAKHQGTR